MRSLGKFPERPVVNLISHPSATQGPRAEALDRDAGDAAEAGGAVAHAKAHQMRLVTPSVGLWFNCQ